LHTICAVVVLPIPGGPERSAALWPAPSSFARIFTKKNKNNNQYNKFEMFIADNKSSLPATTQNNQ